MARSVRRRRRQRSPKRRILVACDGKETEPNYFSGLKKEQVVRDAVHLEIVPGDGKTPLSAVGKAIAAQEAALKRGSSFRFDEVWCVLDVEQAGQTPQLEHAGKLAGQHRFHVAWSNAAFEVWLLAHFERSAAAFLNCDKVRRQLDKHWVREFGCRYEKNDQYLFARIGHRIPDAVNNARWVREHHFQHETDVALCNSSTDVYRLVERLLAPNA